MREGGGWRGGGRCVDEEDEVERAREEGIGAADLICEYSLPFLP
jgi:hypothetical protein